MKKMVTVKLSSKRCTGMLRVDKGREERHGRSEENMGEGREL